MAEMNDALSKLADIAKNFSTQPLIKVPDYSFVNNIVPQIPTVEIDEESTFAYQMQQQTNQIIEKSNEQIRLLNEHNELSHLDKISDAYEECYRKKHRIEIVKVTSASKIDEDQLSRLKEMLENKMNKTLELEVQVDPALIAGIKVQANDLVMDNTVIAKIDAMKEAINR